MQPSSSRPPVDDHFVLRVDELLAAVEEATGCPDCRGALGVCVFFDDPQSWEVIQIHDVPCPRGLTYPTLRSNGGPAAG